MDQRKEQRIKGKDTSVYVVDDAYRIVYSNGDLSDFTLEGTISRPCYEVICGEDSPCDQCPLKAENHGQAIVFNHLRSEWVSVGASEIEWPGWAGATSRPPAAWKKMIRAFYNVLSKSDHTEFLRLNYREDSYTVVYHGDHVDLEENVKGCLSAMVRKVAQRVIHPEDRERFCDYWLLDRIGQEDPLETQSTRHGEFRRLRADGGYCLAQQIFMPVRQGTGDNVYIISFFNVIDEQGQWSDLLLNNGEDETERGLYTKEAFFKHAEKLVKGAANAGAVWSMVSVDIDNLKLFNAWYGMDSGDELLDGVAACLKEFAVTHGGVGGYFGNDDFALITPYDQAEIQQLYEQIIVLMDAYSNKTGFLPALGVYEITDPDESAFTMYDRADLARASVKGNYTVRVRKFDTGMMEKLESSYVLFSDVKKALEEKEFTFFLQPKCDMESGKVMGAEALVRWVSKEKGIISPGVFIPFLEKTGFITELDVYIWEEVCKWQRSMLDRGAQTVPVSVNVSRVDVYSVDVPVCFRELIQKYDLDPDMIEVEITESTYTEDNARIDYVVSELRRSGFRVLMDDFGSGYSSLNMLKEIEIDTLKMDMRFLKISEDNASKGIGILEAVHNMARLIGIGIVVEGVETEEQKNFLLKMGCTCAQGYYFYRPLPVLDFEKLIADYNNLYQEKAASEKVEQFIWKDLLRDDMFSEIMINNLLGPVAVYDVVGDQIKVRQCNDLYISLLSDTQHYSGTYVDPRSLPYEEDYQKLLDMFDRAQEDRLDGAECAVRRRGLDGNDMWLHLRTFFLKEQDGHAVYYSSVSDMTESYQKNEILQQQKRALQFLNNDMPGGYYRQQRDEDCTLTYISDRFLDIVGFTRDEIRARFGNKLRNMVHPDDQKLLHQAMVDVEENGGNYSLSYRLRSKGGYVAITDQYRLVEYNGYQFFQGVILCDVDHDTGKVDNSPAWEAENGSVIDLMPCGIFKYEADGNHEFSYISGSMLDMLGYSRQAFLEKFQNSFTNMVYEEDRDRVAEDIRRQIQNGNYDSCEYRIELPDGSLKWVYDRGRLTMDADGKRWFYVCIMDYDYLKEKYREQEWQLMKYRTLAEIPGMLVYDYEPQHDRLTLELSREDGSIRTMIIERFNADMEKRDWFTRDGVGERRKAFKDALSRPMTGMLELKARLMGDKAHRWYRTRFQSLADEYGVVYRVVGRAEYADGDSGSIHARKRNTIAIRQCDITKLDCTCIVNAANNSLLGGGGVDGAIHRAAGPELLKECYTLHGCETGQAKLTGGYRLPAEHVIHTVGPIYSGAARDAELLAQCYQNALDLAKANDIHSIAFPSISTGAYGYPLGDATRIAVRTVRRWLSEHPNYGMEVIFSCYDQRATELYHEVNQELAQQECAEER